MDILSYIWTVLSFFLSVVWTVVWFVLRDLISTVLWILIVAWMLLSVRYRSFTGGTLALLRYGRWAVNLFWRWLRGTPNPALPPPPQPKVITKEVIKVVGKRRKRFGTMNVSEQLNVLLLGAIWLLFVI
ncbi:hypothetical protein JDN40_16080 [Rhodomicrobium vannielii ATCC 17100]|uniref:hypothetical protein n=1 Tax=Rhodomicrobium vannielii TaxID=1069 RepID=UPI0019198893|nr:hypothetical protein [Rhodomicrobium vannielii]MBJ7535627.1 hypothetical protein [Rhodomicrobium vannielii ATCC 17100]